MTNLLKSTWNEVDPSEIRFILFERIGRPGQYRDRANNPGKFYLPLADSTCRVELTFSEDKELIAIEPGPAFDALQWEEVVQEIESAGAIKVGRDCSFSSFRVTGSWQGTRSGVQILPPPAGAPAAPVEMAEHPFILEFPVKASDRWPITNHRRMTNHRRLTLLLNILLVGRTCVQPRRFRHLWATVPGDSSFGVKWVQEFFFAQFGEAVADILSPLAPERIKEVDPNSYYVSVGHDGRSLEVPADLDDLICCYTQLSPKNRATFDRGSFWMDMAARQWTISLSASFASLVIAIEALGDRSKGPTARFHDYLERYAPGASLKNRRKKMYALRSDILHGSGLMEMDRDADFGWSPPEQGDKDLMEELWGLTKLLMRNWLKTPPQKAVLDEDSLADERRHQICAGRRGNPPLDGTGAPRKALRPTRIDRTAMNVQTSTSKLIKGATGDWEVVIGMEVHAQVNAKAKLFSGAATAFGGAPNSHVSLVDAAMPGMLPVINAECIAQAVRTGLGLNAKINLRSVFDRKNYFYPDLPQGYQISQYKSPVVGEGEVAVDMPYGIVRVGIERLHLEQDAGKSLHDQHPAMSLVDLNRSGVALMEIVSKPDLRSSEEAKAFLTKLRAILRYLGTCDGDMEKGNLRADVNVSVRRPGDPLGTRCEIKNVNSIRFVGQAIDYEARRQIEILEDGGTIEQETRLYDAPRNQTRSMRNKEEAHDYRYFPDPDLLPLELNEAYVAELRRQLPELPDDKKARFMSTFGLAGYDAGVLVAEKESADFFEATVMRADGPARDAKLTANWVLNELFGRLNREDLPISASPVSSAQLGAILDLIAEGTISGKIAKELFEIVWAEGGEPRALVEARGMTQVTDTAAIEKLVDAVIAANPDKVSQAKTKPAMIGWFVGQVMKASGGKANPQAVNEFIKAKLDI